MSRSIPVSFYKSSAWVQCRHAYMLKQNYICECCGDVGTICHHKIHLNADNYQDPSISLNHDLLMCVCQTCHNRIHSVTPAIRNGLAFDEKGNIIKIN